MLSNASTCALVAVMKRSRSSRGRARSGAVFGSTMARAENVDFAEPCSPDSARIGNGPSDRSAASSQATTRANSSSEPTLRKGRNSAIFPPRTGVGSGRWPDARRNRTGGRLTICNPISDLDRMPRRVAEVDVERSIECSGAHEHRAFCAVEMGARLDQTQRGLHRLRVRARPSLLLEVAWVEPSAECGRPNADASHGARSPRGQRMRCRRVIGTISTPGRCR